MSSPATVPIPQGATIGNPNAVPIPEGASIGQPAPQPEDKRSFLQIALDNSPSGADPQNPGNPTQQGLNQMSPEDRASAQKSLAATAAVTAGGALAGPAIAYATELGGEYAEFFGKEGAKKLLQMATQHPE